MVIFLVLKSILLDNNQFSLFWIMFAGYMGFHSFNCNPSLYLKGVSHKKDIRGFQFLCQIWPSLILFGVFRSFTLIVAIDIFRFKATIMIVLSICLICSGFLFFYLLAFLGIRNLLLTSFYLDYWLMKFICFIIIFSGCLCAL